MPRSLRSGGALTFAVLLLAALLQCLPPTSHGAATDTVQEDPKTLVGESGGNQEGPDSCLSAACPDSPGSSEKPIVLLASPSRTDALVTWIKENAAALTGATFAAPSRLATRLSFDPRTLFLKVTILAEDLEEGGDILLAARVLSGKVGGVIFFHDQTTSVSGHDLQVLSRACGIGNVPLALNEVTANLAIRGFAKTRTAYLIFNPVSGQGDPNEDLALIRAALEPNMVLTVVLTQKDRDQAEQAREVVNMIKARPAADTSPMPIIIASGGDGTVSAVAGATMGSGIPFAVIPRGTANAFSVALGIPTGVKAACQNILAGNVRVVDGAMCNDIPMILLAGLGFEAGMVDRATREMKNVLGTLAYVLGGAQQLVAQENFSCNIDIDGKTSDLEVGAITVANVAPPTSVLAQGFGEVIPDDGLLDVTIATSKTFLAGLDALASLVASAVVKTPTESENLLCVRAKKVTVSCDPPQKLVIDGEMFDVDPLTFSVLPQALKVVAPAALA